jgi:hypothetical protein
MKRVSVAVMAAVIALVALLPGLCAARLATNHNQTSL